MTNKPTDKQIEAAAIAIEKEAFAQGFCAPFSHKMSLAKAALEAAARVMHVEYLTKQ